MRRYLFAIFLSLAPLGFLVGCSKKPQAKNKQTLRINLGRDPRTLDPRQGGDNHSYFTICFLFDGLMHLDENGRPTCALAHRVDISDDYRTYTFHLRDAKWSNGMPITSHDFVYSWKSVIDPTYMSEFTYELYPIRGAKAASLGELDLDAVGIKAVDDKTLVVELEKPAAYFLESVTHAAFLPICAANEKLHPKWMSQGGEHFVTSGAFTLDQWRHNDELVLKRNPLYWEKERIRLNEVRCYMLENAVAQLDMFRNGDIDWVGDPCLGLPRELMTEIRHEPGLTFYEVPGVQLANFNTKRGITANLNIRKALSLAIDRPLIAEQVTQSTEVPWTSILPPSLALQQEPYFPVYDPQEARRLFDLGLQELGIDRKSLKPLELLFAGNTGKIKLAETLQQQWEEGLGITVHLINHEWKIFFDDATRGKCDVALWSWTSGLNDPIYNLEIFKDGNGSLNLPKWQNAEFIQTVEEAETTIDEVKRQRLFHKAEQILISEMPLAPIVDCKHPYICSPRLKGVVVSKMGLVDMRMAYIDEDE